MGMDVKVQGEDILNSFSGKRKYTMFNILVLFGVLFIVINCSQAWRWRDKVASIEVC